MPEPIDVVEGLLFASDAPLEADRIRDVLDLESADAARALVAALRERYEQEARARTRVRLSRAALEALAIVAYKQPVSRPEIDAVRGVNSEGVLDNLLERRLVRIAGRKDAPGRPFLFETTREFLVAFGLRDLGDLPTVDGELVLPDLTPGGEGAEAPEPGDGQPQAEQDPGPGGSELPPRR